MSGGVELEARIADLIRDALQVEVPAADADLIESGLLDSLAVISLITEIEAAFSFELPLDEFDIESFRSVARMAELVSAHTAGKTA
jgi:D-alanine--poly(phosphoribitol) ligase subunit 2